MNEAILQTVKLSDELHTLIFFANMRVFLFIVIIIFYLIGI